MTDDMKLAKSLFLHQQLSPKAIEGVTGIDEAIIRHEIYAPNGWLYEFNNSPAITQEQYEMMAPIVLTEIKARSLEIIKKSLKRFAAEDKIEEMTTSDILNVTSVLTQIDKIDRLDRGKATSITGVDLDRMDAKEVISLRRSKSDYMNEDYTYTVHAGTHPDNLSDPHSGHSGHSDALHSDNHTHSDPNTFPDTHTLSDNLPDTHTHPGTHTFPAPNTFSSEDIDEI